MTFKPLIVSLVGLPGSGKTTVGRQLAKRLRLPFVDSDHEIEVRIGEPIRLFFERQGEAQFRNIEEQILQELCAASPCVLSTGGGVVLRPNNRKTLHGNGHVVYLKSNPEELFKRLRHDQSRPLLQVADPLAKLRDLFATRDPLYRETAHFVMETGRPSVPTLVNMIVMQLELAGAMDNS